MQTLSENTATADVIFREIFHDCTGIFYSLQLCRETVKVFRLLLSPYSLIGTCNSVQNWTFRECTAYCSCREAVNLFRFLLSPYSLIGTCNNMQNCIFRWGRNCVHLGNCSMVNLDKPWSKNLFPTGVKRKYKYTCRIWRHIIYFIFYRNYFKIYFIISIDL
jgi:hypothetical protein